MVAPLLVGRDRSIRAIESSMEKDQRLFFVLQRATKVNDPREEDLHAIGTLGTAIQFVKLSDGTVKVLVEGECRGRLLRLIPHEPYSLAEVEEIETSSQPTLETEAMMRSVVNLFGTYASPIRGLRWLPPSKWVTDRLKYDCYPVAEMKGKQRL
jgi:ATP-dependent Lon protease